MRKLVCILLFTALYFSSFSQQLKGSYEKPWRMVSYGTNQYDDNYTDWLSQQSILYLSDSIAAVCITERENAKSYKEGVVLVNNRGQELWKNILPEKNILGTAILQDNILVLSEKKTSNKSKFSQSNAIDFTLINSKNGKIIKEQPYPLTRKNFCQIYLVKSNTGIFQYLMIRETFNDAETRPSYTSKYRIAMRHTKSVDFYHINNQLEATLAASHKDIAGDMEFVNVASDSNGTVHTAWIMENQLLLDTHVKGAEKRASRIATPLIWDKEWAFANILQVNSNALNQVAFSKSYVAPKTRALKTVLYDVDKKEANVFDEELSNNYRDQIHETALVSPDEKEKSKKTTFSLMQVSNIHFYENKAVVVKESKGESRMLRSGGSYGAPRYYNGEVLITVNEFGKKEVKHFLVNRFMEQFGGFDFTLGTRVLNEKLQMVMPNLPAPAVINTLYGELDLKQMKWTTLSAVKEGSRELRGIDGIDGKLTLWFPRFPVLAFLHQQSLFNSTMTNQLKLMTY